jgi:hypothetical protein
MGETTMNAFVHNKINQARMLLNFDPVIRSSFIQTQFAVLKSHQWSPQDYLDLLKTEDGVAPYDESSALKCLDRPAVAEAFSVAEEDICIVCTAEEAGRDCSHEITITDLKTQEVLTCHGTESAGKSHVSILKY